MRTPVGIGMEEVIMRVVTAAETIGMSMQKVRRGLERMETHHKMIVGMKAVKTLGIIKNQVKGGNNTQCFVKTQIPLISLVCLTYTPFVRPVDAYLSNQTKASVKSPYVTNA